MRSCGNADVLESAVRRANVLQGLCHMPLCMPHTWHTALARCRGSSAACKHSQPRLHTFRHQQENQHRGVRAKPEIDDSAAPAIDASVVLLESLYAADPQPAATPLGAANAASQPAKAEAAVDTLVQAEQQGDAGGMLEALYALEEEATEQQQQQQGIQEAASASDSGAVAGITATADAGARPAREPRPKRKQRLQSPPRPKLPPRVPPPVPPFGPPTIIRGPQLPQGLQGVMPRPSPSPYSHGVWECKALAG